MEFPALRDDMVDGLESAPKAVLADDAIAAAMCETPRHEFVPDERTAYADCGHVCLGTRVLAPSTVARLLEALSPNPDDSVLIVGAGVGYTAAVLAELVGERNVHAVEIARPVVAAARDNLERAGYGGVLVDRADGANGLPAYAPFDRILVEAAAVEPPNALREQLAPGGRLVFPRGGQPQRLEAVTTTDLVETYGTVSFDPLLVDGEQTGAVERNRTVREDVEHAQRRAATGRGWEQQWIEWDDVSDAQLR